MEQDRLDTLLASRPQIVAEALDRIHKRQFPSYEALPSSQLEEVVGNAVTAGIDALARGESDLFESYAVGIGGKRAVQGGYQLWEIIGMSLCIKDATKKVVAQLYNDPQELLVVLEKIDQINDRAIIKIADSYSRGKEEAIRAEEAGNIGLIEALKDEIAETDRRIQQLESQISAARADMKEMQNFRDALLSRLVNVGMAEIIPTN